MSRSRIVLLIGLLLLATGAQAQVAQTPVAGVDGPLSQPEGGGCAIVNLQGALASGFLSWTVPGGGQATYIDPTGTGGAGDPGCGGGTFDDSDFAIDSVLLDIADASAFMSGTGVVDATWSLTIHDLATPGDSCGGPGAILFDSGPMVLNADGSGQYFPDVPVGISVSGPFFVQWNIIDLSNPAEPVSTLWDGVARPLCRAFITQDGGATYVDQTDFFVGGENGWQDVVVSGDFVPRGTTLDIPTLGQAGIAGLAVILALLGAFVIRRRMA